MSKLSKRDSALLVIFGVDRRGRWHLLVLRQAGEGRLEGEAAGVGRGTGRVNQLQGELTKLTAQAKKPTTVAIADELRLAKAYPYSEDIPVLILQIEDIAKQTKVELDEAHARSGNRLRRRHRYAVHASRSRASTSTSRTSSIACTTASRSTARVGSNQGSPARGHEGRSGSCRRRCGCWSNDDGVHPGQRKHHRRRLQPHGRRAGGTGAGDPARRRQHRQAPTPEVQPHEPHTDVRHCSLRSSPSQALPRDVAGAAATQPQQRLRPRTRSTGPGSGRSRACNAGAESVIGQFDPSDPKAAKDQTFAGYTGSPRPGPARSSSTRPPSRAGGRRRSAAAPRRPGAPVSDRRSPRSRPPQRRLPATDRPGRPGARRGSSTASIDVNGVAETVTVGGARFRPPHRSSPSSTSPTRR